MKLAGQEIGIGRPFFLIAGPCVIESAELTQHVATLLTKHKRPREVHFVDELPRNAMGKVMKRELRT